MNKKFKEETEPVVAVELQSFNYPSLGGAVIKAASQADADVIALRLLEDIKKNN